MIKRHPWWLRLVYGKEDWVTIFPNIYTEQDPHLCPSQVLHECVHLRQQQAIGKYKWLWKYATERQFRLLQEAEAISVELDVLTEPEATARYNWYLTALTGKYYRYAASSVQQAGLAIYWMGAAR